ncbi:MAG: Ecf-type RNA polymerase sigma factor [marine bacterium B5-7]|nr:MAG: Ecf-type RNA polymerase sigma factor [marine bacterium B5-7]
MEDDISDESLMLKYASGDVVAFEVLYVRHKGAVYRYLLNLCRNDAVAEELFQEVWMKLINAKEKYQVKAKFTTYIYKVAHNLFIDHYRKQNVRIVVDQSIEIDELEQEHLQSNNPEGQVQGYQIISKLSGVLESLPDEQREVFLLREEAGMSVPEIAETLGINQEAAKSRLRYAINKLRVGLKDT